jgi:hypothetical protein
MAANATDLDALVKAVTAAGDVPTSAAAGAGAGGKAAPASSASSAAASGGSGARGDATVHARVDHVLGPVIKTLYETGDQQVRPNRQRWRV